MSSVAHADFATRMEVLKQLSARTGIRLPATIIPEGESLIPYGEQRQRALKEEIESLPTVEEAAHDLAAINRERAPKDVPVQAQSILMDPRNGGLFGKGSDSNKALGYSEVAFSQAAYFMKPESVKGGFAQTLLALPPKIRAEAFNYFATATEDRQVILRTILAPQQTTGKELVQLRRTIQAVVSERYSAVADHDLALDLNAVMPAGARARYTQTEGRSDLEIFWPAMTRQLKVGDIALIALAITNSQTKTHTIKLVAKILRVLCLNFTTAWGTNDGEEISIRHIGEARQKFREAVRRALATVEPFIHAFGDAYQNPLPQARGEVVAKVIKAFELPQKFGAEVVGVWDADGDKSAGDTLAGLANAMTRASQEHTMERAAVIEEAAGRLVRNGWTELGL